MKKILSLALVAMMLLSLLSGCGEKQITAEQAQQIVLKDLGVSADQVTMHTHITTYENEACYSIYATVNGETFEYIINSIGGEILSVQQTVHTH